MIRLLRAGPAAILALIVLTGLILVASQIPPSRTEHTAETGLTTDGRLPELVALEPGLRVDDAPPPGWSHLVVKSVPRLASGDRDSLPGASTGTVPLFRTVILADVRTQNAGRDYALRRVGVGLALPEGGHDVVVTPGQPGRARSALDRLALELAARELGRGRLVARTSTFALFRTPVKLVGPGGHRPADLNYALLVGPRSGRLTALVWPSAEGDPGEPGRELVELPPGLVFDCPLDVVATQLPGGLPVAWSFAMTGLPPGRARPWPEGLDPGSIHSPGSAASARATERALRAVLDDGP